MPDPIVFVSHGPVMKGKLQALREFSLEVWPVLEGEKPNTVFQYGYLDGCGDEVHFVHWFPSAEAFDAHIAGARERTGAAAEFIDTYEFEIYGAPSDETLSALRQAPNVESVVRPESVGGYIRLSS